MKEIEKSIRELIKGSKEKEAEKMLPELYKVLDKATKKNIIKKNKASRTKSRITKAIKKKNPNIEKTKPSKKQPKE